MKGKEIREEVAERREDHHAFIKWWRREHDFMHVELLDPFLAKLTDEEEIEGFELLGMQEMWDHLQRIDPGHIARQTRTHGVVIVWERPEKEGADRTRTCPYTPESLMTIYDVETRGIVPG